MPKDVTVNSTHYFIMKIRSIQEPNRIASHHLSDIDYKGFINLYKKCTANPYSFSH